VFNILKSIKNIFIHIRSSLKFIFLLIIATALIIGILSIAYRPLYSVTIDGVFVGYTANRSTLQQTINAYKVQGDGANISFIDIQATPEYSLRLVRRDTETNDEEILASVKQSGVTYYRYYAIVLDNEVTQYVQCRETAQAIVNELTERRSENVSRIAYMQINRAELQEFAEADAVVASLFVAPRPAPVARGGAGVSTNPGRVSYNPSIEIAFIRPTSGIISSPFGPRRGGFHAGIDYAPPHGTPIHAAASGTVTRAGASGSGFGNFVIINHGNGVETLYAHAHLVLVSVGQTVAQGEQIATVGSTGNSTGPHLHFEIRLNGVSLNPAHYI